MYICSSYIVKYNVQYLYSTGDASFCVHNTLLHTYCYHNYTFVQMFFLNYGSQDIYLYVALHSYNYTANST